ncbi:MAG: hypothetical protein C4542_00085 [Dehalococcoidia bacterium]|nr:MAG: hypothetical protein C4542_00085 [Dehalococcoidia bacterium]
MANPSASGYKPKYFLAAFGSIHHAANPIEGGNYPLLAGYVTSQNVQPGDVILLYCTGGYPSHFREAPGVGIVTDIDAKGNSKIINYWYLPFNQAIPLEILKLNIPELENNTNFGNRGNFLRAISKPSFNAALANTFIDWP